MAFETWPAGEDGDNQLDRETPLRPRAANGVEMFDPGVAWGRLGIVQRARFGRLGLALAYLIEAADPRSGMPIRAAEQEHFDRSGSAVVRLLAEALDAADLFSLDERGRRPARIDLNAIGIRQCTNCGCTESVGCPGGCSWVGPSLCSFCLFGDGR